MKELIPNEILLGCAKQMLAEGHTVTLRVAGYSMRPLLEHRRDSVVLAAAEGCKLHDVVLAEIERTIMSYIVLWRCKERMSL